MDIRTKRRIFTLKEALNTAPVLKHLNSDIPFEVLTDASKYAVRATLRQNAHPVAYLSHCLSDAEICWDTGYEELFAFIRALRDWELCLKGRKLCYTELMDHCVTYNLRTAYLGDRQGGYMSSSRMNTR